ncbi:MAG: carbohydrate kinase [Sphaerochaetaceae bacterium]|nr:carbohydrate kinase [Sphaerochaetaceae bacterium]
MFDAVALGELLVDFACTQINRDGYPILDAHPGGAPANFLATIQRFGGKTALIGKVGTDAFGQLLRKTLSDIGINDEGIISEDDVFTTLAFVTFNEFHDRQFSFARKPGADTCLEQGEVVVRLIDDAKVFHFGTLSLTEEPARGATRFAVEYARSQGILISYDPNLRKPLWKELDNAKQQMFWGLGMADVVKMSDEEVLFMFGNESLEKIATAIVRDYNVKLVYITLGKDGCIFANQHGVGTAGTYDDGIVVCDTTGAGDIFGGSAMWALLQTGKSPDELTLEELYRIVRFATISAGISTTRTGGISSIPSLSEIIRRM